MTDRRRINGPPSGTQPPVYAAQLAIPSTSTPSLRQPTRTRAPNQLRKIFLRTGLTPSASGSAYLELQPPPPPQDAAPPSLLAAPSALKLSVAVHGPKPLPRSAPFSPQLVLSAHVKFAPYASRGRRHGFVRDALERDLSVHLETALRGVVLGDRWPKSGVDVAVTVLEAEDDAWWGPAASDGSGSGSGVGGVGAMTVLAGCVTAASAAMLEAGIDCVDVVTGGVAAAVGAPGAGAGGGARATQVVQDPCPAEHAGVDAACVVAYLASRDELTELWTKGDLGAEPDALIGGAVEAAMGARTVLTAVLKEAAEARGQAASAAATSNGEVKAPGERDDGVKGGKGKGKQRSRGGDVEMSG